MFIYCKSNSFYFRHLLLLKDPIENDDSSSNPNLSFLPPEKPTKDGLEFRLRRAYISAKKERFDLAAKYLKACLELKEVENEVIIR